MRAQLGQWKVDSYQGMDCITLKLKDRGRVSGIGYLAICYLKAGRTTADVFNGIVYEPVIRPHIAIPWRVVLARANLNIDYHLNESLGGEVSGGWQYLCFRSDLYLAGRKHTLRSVHHRSPLTRAAFH